MDVGSRSLDESLVTFRSCEKCNLFFSRIFSVEFHLNFSDEKMCLSTRGGRSWGGWDSLDLLFCSSTQTG